VDIDKSHNLNLVDIDKSRNLNLVDIDKLLRVVVNQALFKDAATPNKGKRTFLWVNFIGKRTCLTVFFIGKRTCNKNMCYICTTK